MKFANVAAIKAFQKKHGLVVDGIIGPQTRRVIRELETPVSKAARKEPDKSAINVKAPSAPPVTVPVLGPVAPIVLKDTARSISEIIFHCAATPEGKWFDRADINAWHKQRGWAMIGYHYVILLDGTIQEGRPIGMVGAHCEGHNTGTIGVVYVGGLSADGKRAKDTRTPRQVSASHWLISELKAKFKIGRRVRGHNEYNKGKACPSFNVARDPLGGL